MQHFNEPIRRITSVLLAGLLLLTAAGCGSGQTSGSTAVTDSEAAETSMAETNGTSGGNTSASTVTIPINENTAEVWRQVIGNTAEAEEESEESTAEETVDCEYTRTGKPAVALTFDDGPRSGTTDQILDVLEKYDAHATFFIVGENVSSDPDALKRMVSLGCELGTHTWSHLDLTTLGNKKFNNQINKSISAIEDASGGTVTLIRPPYGSIDDDVKQKLDLPIILWSLDTLDWSTRDAAATLKTVKKNVKGGDIILMHDIHQETADAVEPVVKWLQKKGYELLTVSELYEYYGEELTLHKGHGSAG